MRLNIPDILFFDPTLTTNVAAVTLPTEFDSRDHERFPRHGWLVKGEAKLFRESVGSDFDAEVYKLAINHYRPVRYRDALAFQ